MDDQAPANPPRRVRCYAFGAYFIDLTHRLLLHGTEPVNLTAKTFDVLLFLVEHRNRIIEKEEFFSTIWRDTIVLEANLVRHISLIRRALGQRPDQHDYIVTVPGRGYHFSADVEELPCLPTQASSSLPATAAVAVIEGEPPTGSPELAVEEPVLSASSTDIARPADAQPTRRPRRVLWTGLATAAAVGLMAVLGTSFGDPSVASSPIAERLLHRVTFDGGTPPDVTWAPDGRRLAFTSEKDGNADIWIQSTSEAKPTRLTDSPAQDWQPSWAPDGQNVAFRSERDGGGLYLVAASGGTAKRIADFGYRPRWSPDGSQILVTDSAVRPGTRKAYAIPAHGGVPVLVRPDVIAEFTSPGWSSAVTVGWYPDGQRVSIWGRHPRLGYTMMTVPVGGGAGITSAIPPEVRKQFDDSGLVLRAFVWAPTRRYLYFNGVSEYATNIWRVAVDPTTLAWIGRLERLTTGPGEDVALSLSPDGTRLAFTSLSVRTRLWSYPLDGATGRIAGAGAPVALGKSADIDVDSSPDGQELVYQARRGDRQELWVHSVASGEERLLVSSTGSFKSAPRWSSDGLKLAYRRTAFRSDRASSEYAVGIVSVRGGQEALLAPPPNKISLVPRDWSKDGNYILGTCAVGLPERSGTCVMASKDAAVPKLIAFDPTQNLFCQQFSPDQRWISFLAMSADDPSRSRVYVIPSGGGQWIPVTDGLSYDDKPRWDPSGRVLFFISNRGGFLNVWARRFDSASGSTVGDAFRVTNFSDPGLTFPTQVSRAEISIAPNRIFLPLTERTGDVWVMDNVDH